MKKSDTLPVRLRGGFSDRMGIKCENITMQTTDLDDRTRITLANTIFFLWNESIENAGVDRGSPGQHMFISILSDLYMQQIVHNRWYDPREVLGIVNNTLINDTFDAVLTTIEYLATKFMDIGLYSLNRTTYDRFNSVFEKEFVGYRFVNGQITPITNEIEIEEIEQASSSEFDQVNDHINKALDMLSNRDNPDYKNSIKESISAVEAICSIIIGKASTLGDALNKLENNGLTIHPSLKLAFEKLYGYTSDATGIRHAGQIDGEDATFEESKFMLVTCCAFVNYLIGVKSKLKL